MSDDITTLREQIAKLTEQVQTLSNASPTTQDKYARDARMQRIARDRQTVAALVAGGPDERAAIICAMPETSFRTLIEMMDLSTITTVARGLPTDERAFGQIARWLNPVQLNTLFSELVETSKLPKMIAVTNKRPDSTFSVPGYAIAYGQYALFETTSWGPMAESVEVSAARARGTLEVSDATERQIRTWLLRKLNAGELVIDPSGRLYDPNSAPSRAVETESMDARVSVDRVRAADRKANLKTVADSGATETHRITAVDRAKNRDAQRLARAIVDEQDKREAKRAKKAK